MGGVLHRMGIHCWGRTKERQIGDAIEQDAEQLGLRRAGAPAVFDLAT